MAGHQGAIDLTYQNCYESLIVIYPLSKGEEEKL
jgi:hypothetical protein